MVVEEVVVMEETSAVLVVSVVLVVLVALVVLVTAAVAMVILSSVCTAEVRQLEMAAVEGLLKFRDEFVKSADNGEVVFPAGLNLSQSWSQKVRDSGGQELNDTRCMSGQGRVARTGALSRRVQGALSRDRVIIIPFDSDSSLGSKLSNTQGSS
jgi:hypothetical protein